MCTGLCRRFYQPAPYHNLSPPTLHLDGIGVGKSSLVLILLKPEINAEDFCYPAIERQIHALKWNMISDCNLPAV
jgi:hypothetical protein